MDINYIIKRIFTDLSSDEFNEISLKIFLHQYDHNKIYTQFVDCLSIHPKKIKHFTEIPFLPIRFFKTQQIITGNVKPEKIFSSSGTTGMERSQHFVADISVYEKSLKKGFENFYGNIKDYCLVALLPSYQKNSSLIYMTDKLIHETNYIESGFYDDNEKVIDVLKNLSKKKIKTILLAVSYALLDLADISEFDFHDVIIMETGGMKGRKKEIIRSELHEILKKRFHVNTIHSEYGMTELLSQAYSKGDGNFFTPPWMKILIREMNDPFHFIENKKTGGINVIDFANIHSCSFISTEDLGQLNDDGSFQVIGRFDNSDVRGCNLMVSTM